MRNLFVYGSLMYEEVWTRLVRSPCPRQPAVLAGYKRLGIRGETYPGIIRSRGSVVRGVLVEDVAPADIMLLDRFEGRQYHRRTVTVTREDGAPVRADTYVLCPRHACRLSAGEWDADAFRRLHIRTFIARYAGFR